VGFGFHEDELGARQGVGLGRLLLLYAGTRSVERSGGDMAFRLVHSQYDQVDARGLSESATGFKVFAPVGGAGFLIYRLIMAVLIFLLVWSLGYGLSFIL
jgi:hypothetical protein